MSATHGSTAGNAVMIAPRISRKIVPGVNKDDMNKNSW